MNRLFDYDEPIISSLLETDTYKIRMMYYLWTFFPEVKTKFAFKNRTTSVRLLDEIDINQVKEQLDFAKTLRFQDTEIEILSKREKYPKEFLKFIKDLQLSDINVKGTNDGQLSIETSEDFCTKTALWELIVLPIVNELYARNSIQKTGLSDEVIIAEGERRMRQKAELLAGSGVRALQFGLRRRLSGWWEKHMTEMAFDLMSDVIVAISNMNLALDLRVLYGGTNAHELSMMLNALRWNLGSEAAWQSQYEVFDKWFELFPESLRIILPDTFGSKQFLDNIPKRLAQGAKGFRQDSGNPVEFGYWVIDMYRRFGIESRERILFFSDGLNPYKMLDLYQEFGDKINVLFGWGTNFSNDTGYVKPLSIVMKLVRAGGNSAVKLSDNIAKAIGEEGAVARNKELFGYDVTLNEKCVY